MRILDGPPFTNGNIHIGTAYNKILKDVFLRLFKFKRLNYNIVYGWDMHGLPIELKIETNKQNITNITNFIQNCANFAESNLHQMKEQFNKLNLLIPITYNEYKTHSVPYYNSVWKIFYKLYFKDRIYNDETIINWCKNCETSLANSEIINAEDYITEYYFCILLKNNYKILVCTTTLYTLPLNKFVVYNKNLEYVVIKINSDNVICSKSYAILNKHDYAILNFELEGLEYFNFDYNINTNCDAVYKLYHADFVTDAYTGFVHIVPEHGLDDLEFSKKVNYKLDIKIDSKGNYLFDSNFDFLKYTNLIYKTKNSESKKQICWRCKTQIINIVSKQWFLKVDDIKNELLEYTNKITVDKIHKTNLQNWIKNAKNWCISRQRYWGIPLPIWKSKNNFLIIESIEHLEQLSKKNIKLEEIFDVEFTYNNEKYTHIKEIFDVWFESGCAYINLDLNFNLIIEAHDQIRGWFYSLLVINYLVYNTFKIEKIIIHGFIMQNKTQKYSKSKGNILILENIDELRNLLLTKPIGEDFIFDENELINVKKWKTIYLHTINFLNTKEYIPIEKNKYEVQEQIVSYLDNFLIKLVLTLGEPPIKEIQLHKYWISFKNTILNISRQYVKYIKKPLKYISQKTFNTHKEISQNIANYLIEIYSIFTGIKDTNPYNIDLKYITYDFKKIFKIISKINEFKQKNNINLNIILDKAYLNTDLNEIEILVLENFTNILEIKKGKFQIILEETEKSNKLNLIKKLIRNIQLERSNLNLKFEEKIKLYLRDENYTSKDLEIIKIETNSEIYIKNINSNFEINNK